MNCAASRAERAPGQDAVLVETESFARESLPGTAVESVRVRLPLVAATDDGPKVCITNEQIEEVFESDDLDKYAQ